MITSIVVMNMFVRHAKKDKMRHFYVIMIFILTINTKTNCQVLPKGDFYRYDTLEIIKKVSYDSIRFDLYYVEIAKDSIWYAVIPMYSNQTNYFSFISDNNRFSYTKINKTPVDYYSTLIFTNDNMGKISDSNKMIEKRDVRISRLNDSILIIDNKRFKFDKGLKIFQSFTGY